MGCTNKPITTIILMLSFVTSLLALATVSSYPKDFKRHASPLIDWEPGLKEATRQVLLRNRNLSKSIRDKLLTAPIIGKENRALPFGDIAVLARGQLFAIPEGFRFIQDPYQNDCIDCHPSRFCKHNDCGVYKTHGSEKLLALWSVKRIRHRDGDLGHRYELEYTISPINTHTQNSYLNQFGGFDYNIPGHVFIVRTNNDQPDFVKVYHNEHFVSNSGQWNNRKYLPAGLPPPPVEDYYLPILSTEGTAFHPLRPTGTHEYLPAHHGNRPNYQYLPQKPTQTYFGVPSTAGTKFTFGNKNDLYKKLLESLAQKTSSIPTKSIPHRFGPPSKTTSHHLHPITTQFHSQTSSSSTTHTVPSTYSTTHTLPSTIAHIPTTAQQIPTPQIPTSFIPMHQQTSGYPTHAITTILLPTTVQQTTKLITSPTKITTKQTTHLIPILTTKESTPYLTTKQTTPYVTTKQTTPRVITTKQATPYLTTKQTTSVKTKQTTPRVITTKQATPYVTTKQTTPYVTTSVKTKQTTPRVITTKQTTPYVTTSVKTKQTTSRVITKQTTPRVITTKQTTPYITSKQTVPYVITKETTPFITTPYVTTIITTPHTNKQTTEVTMPHVTSKLTTPEATMPFAPTKETTPYITTKETIPYITTKQTTPTYLIPNTTSYITTKETIPYITTPEIYLTSKDETTTYKTTKETTPLITTPYITTKETPFTTTKQAVDYTTYPSFTTTKLTIPPTDSVKPTKPTQQYTTTYVDTSKPIPTFFIDPTHPGYPRTTPITPFTESYYHGVEQTPSTAIDTTASTVYKNFTGPETTSNTIITTTSDKTAGTTTLQLPASTDRYFPETTPHVIKIPLNSPKPNTPFIKPNVHASPGDDYSDYELFPEDKNKSVTTTPATTSSTGPSKPTEGFLLHDDEYFPNKLKEEELDKAVALFEKEFTQKPETDKNVIINAPTSNKEFDDVFENGTTAKPSNEENDGDLFGSVRLTTERSQIIPTENTKAKIIYSGFFEPSTTPVMTTEMEIVETTTVAPMKTKRKKHAPTDPTKQIDEISTKQSFSTSVSYKVNKYKRRRTPTRLPEVKDVTTVKDKGETKYTPKHIDSKLDENTSDLIQVESSNPKRINLGDNNKVVKYKRKSYSRNRKVKKRVEN